MNAVRRGWALGAVALAVAASGCQESAEPQAAASTAAQPKAVVISTGQIELRPVERTVDIVGTLKGWEEVTIGSKRAGRVVKVLHDMGDRVEPGEPLVELETIDAELAVRQAESQYLGELVKLGITQQQADEFVQRFGLTEQLLRGEVADRVIQSVPAVLQVRATLEKAQRDLMRQRQLLARGVGTPEELQDYESSARNAQAAYDNAVATARSVIASAMAARVAREVAREALKDTVIRAPQPTLLPEGHTGPIRYAVTRRAVAEGQMLAAGQEVVDLVIENPLRLWANVPERFSAEIEVGRKVRVTVAAYPGQEFVGQVVRINPAVDPVSRTFQVDSVIPNDGNRLRPGGFAKAAIVTRRTDRATVVPVEAIERFAGVEKLFLIPGEGPNSTARSIAVETGVAGPGWVEVTGLTEPMPTSGRVAISGLTALSQLTDGTPVIVRPPDGEPQAKPGAAPASSEAAAQGEQPGPTEVSR